MSDQEKIQEKERLKSTLIYRIILNEGVQDLSRPAQSLLISGIAAGIALPVSLLAKSLLHLYLPDEQWRPVLESFGYCFGFVLVIMARLQLFTEQTITAVLPLLNNFNAKQLLKTARLWGIVLFANMLGTFLLAIFTVQVGIMPPETVDAMLTISSKFAAMSASEAFVYGIPAGFLIAAIAWMLPNAEGNEFWIIVVFTYVIALGGFSHAIVGSYEVFLLVFSGELAFLDGAFGLILPAVAGNIIGGTGLFTLLAYGQVSEEL